MSSTDTALFSYAPTSDGSRLSSAPAFFRALRSFTRGDELSEHTSCPVDAAALAAFNAERNTGSFSPAADRAIGAVLGMAVGDAVGAPIEFMPYAVGAPPVTADGRTPLPGVTFKNAFSTKPGQWTDDASMGLCLADSLLARGRLDPLDVALRFCAWWYGGYNNSFRFDTARPDRTSIGLGGMIGASLSAFLKDGRAVTSSGNRESSGNGSIMRLAPVPVFYSSLSPSAAAAAARAQSLVTHAGDEARECAALMAVLIVRAINTCGNAEARKASVLDALATTALVAVPHDADAAARATALEFDPALIFFTTDCPSVYALARGTVVEQGPDGGALSDRDWRWRAPEYHFAPGRAAAQPTYVGSYCMDALAMALHCVYATDSFDAAVLKAVNLRGDADSVASVTGQIAGAIYGASTIRREWVADVERWDGGGSIAYRANRLFAGKSDAGVTPAKSATRAGAEAAGGGVSDGEAAGHAGKRVTLVISEAGAPEAVVGGGFNVAPAASCPHVAAALVGEGAGAGVPSCTPGGCRECGAVGEVWRCLTCGAEGCSRHVAGHAAAHAAAHEHPVALGWSDLSVWCFACDSYIDAFKIPDLHEAFTAAHVIIFGEKPPLPT